jgi:NADP-dependent 3-hydroxy acid dehydrogenase YdfG
MQHGVYVPEFERELFRRGFAISHHSLGKLVDRVDFSKLKVPASSFARCVLFAMSQSEDVDINEILFRPTRQDL